ncbi:hypothetical protein F4779DRAFT_351447 [Xylariaceae sp. FL0662B]|nr:hypothetical protein F4779DRAFT_351447 [Xylariaceae sp. FL0662B]
MPGTPERSPDRSGEKAPDRKYVPGYNASTSSTREELNRRPQDEGDDVKLPSIRQTFPELQLHSHQGSSEAALSFGTSPEASSAGIITPSESDRSPNVHERQPSPPGFRLPSPEYTYSSSGHDKQRSSVDNENSVGGAGQVPGPYGSPQQGNSQTKPSLTRPLATLPENLDNSSRDGFYHARNGSIPPIRTSSSFENHEQRPTLPSLPALDLEQCAEERQQARSRSTIIYNEHTRELPTRPRIPNSNDNSADAVSPACPLEPAIRPGISDRNGKSIAMVSPVHHVQQGIRPRNLAGDRERRPDIPPVHPLQPVLRLNPQIYSENGINMSTPLYIPPASYDCYPPNRRQSLPVERNPFSSVYNHPLYHPFNMRINEIGMGMTAETKPRKRRGNLPKETTDKLRSWFVSHLTHPYPSEEEKQNLIRQTGLQLNQISNWFINARRRQLPGIMNTIRAEARARNGRLGKDKILGSGYDRSRKHLSDDEIRSLNNVDLERLILNRMANAKRDSM